MESNLDLNPEKLINKNELTQIKKMESNLDLNPEKLINKKSTKKGGITINLESSDDEIYNNQEIKNLENNEDIKIIKKKYIRKQ